MPKIFPYVVWFKDVGHDDIPLVGGKGANLGEMTRAGFPVPNGFVVTSPAYFYFLDHNHLREKIREMLHGLDVRRTAELTRVSQQIRKLVNQAPVPEDLAMLVMKTYLKLGKDALVAVRSSATAEDLPDASFAGQQDTFLNVKGEANLMEKVKDAWSSLFTPRAIFYREEKHFDHFKVGIAIPVQLMVQSEISGVMFTVNPVTNDKSKVIIEAIYGLGELIVQGEVTPDHYEVLKRDCSISKKEINRQTKMMDRNTNDFSTSNVIKHVALPHQKKQKLPDKLIIEVASWGDKINQHYFFPQDIEWAVEKGKVFITQTRPITTMAEITESIRKGRNGQATKGLEKILSGDPASPGLVSGPAIVIRSIKEIGKVRLGEILVMEMTTPDFVPAMRKAVGIITDQGGQTSHAAIVSRELGVACVVGTQVGTKKIKTGTVITVDGATGDVFRGGMIKQVPSSKFPVSSVEVIHKKSQADLSSIKTATKLYVNLAEPELAERIAAENIDGVGLLRAEFMIAQIGIHPKKMIQDGNSHEFVESLALGLTTFAAAFDPRPVIYRATDFRTNEYRNLKGGESFEPQESNPMIGYRGAFRYMKDSAVFELELQAIKQVREHYRNLHLMIPFVRSVQELVEVKKIVYGKGLRRTDSFQFWMMAELPVNVISIEDFIKVGIDGISIGSNDLTMLILGTDRDNQEIASEFSELNPAVLWSLERLIRTSVKAGVTCSICGQAPSIYPELTKMLVEWGVTSISVSPDRIEDTRRLIYEAEEKTIKRNN